MTDSSVGLALVAVVAAALAAGCLGTETGNPPFTVELGIDAHSSDRTVAALLAPEGGIVVDEAWLSLGDIGFLEDGRCTGTATPPVHVPAPGIGDHAAPGHLSKRFEVRARSYCALAATFVVAPTDLPDGAPAELAGAVLAIAGRTAAGTDFLIVGDSALDIRVRAVAGTFSLAPDDASVLLGFDVATWFAGLDLDAGTPDGTGRIVVSPTENAELLAAFEANLAPGLELFRDADRDGAADTPDMPLARGAP